MFNDDNYYDLKHKLVEMEDYTTKLEKRVVELEKRMVLHEEKRKAATRNMGTLEMEKADFLASKPDERVDPFGEVELVFWASYVVRNTARREKLANYAEVGKRRKKIKELIAHFGEKYGDGENNGVVGRQMTKVYLRHVLAIEKFGDKVNNFWLSTSDFAVNRYGNYLREVAQMDNLPDESLD